MKILFIGGTGNISSTLSRLIVEQGHELHLINRGKTSKYPLPKGVKVIAHDVHSGAPPAALRGAHYDVVVDWIAFTTADVERDIAWFAASRSATTGSTSSSARPRPTRSRRRTRSSRSRRRWPTRTGSTRATRSPAKRR